MIFKEWIAINSTGSKLIAVAVLDRVIGYYMWRFLVQ